MRFCDIELVTKSSSGQECSINCKTCLDLLNLPNGINKEQRSALTASAYKKNSKFRNSKNILDDPYLSSIQLAYGHAITCYKAQGSEWDTVIMNTWMYRPDYRQLYTGITRAKNKLFTNNAHRYL
jgi:exodeoxyribonuclease V